LKKNIYTVEAAKKEIERYIEKIKEGENA